jgi:hypothetical protein
MRDRWEEQERLGIDRWWEDATVLDDLYVRRRNSALARNEPPELWPVNRADRVVARRQYMASLKRETKLETIKRIQAQRRKDNGNGNEEEKTE